LFDTNIGMIQNMMNKEAPKSADKFENS